MDVGIYYKYDSWAQIVLYFLECSMNVNFCACLEANVQGLVSRKRLAKDKAEKALLMLKGALDYSDFKEVDMVIEVS